MQRKFVNKKRIKRKYTRKTEEISSFSFSKTAYGMLPILVMLVAFMSTIVISIPFRDALSNVRFTFEPPQFSLDNPLSFIQSLTSNVIQLSLVILTIMHVVSTAFTQSMAAFFSSTVHTAGVVQNGVELQKEATVNTFAFIGQEITNAFGTIWYFCVSIIEAIVTAITHTIINIGQLISIAVVSVAQTIAAIFTYIAHAVIAVVLWMYGFIAMIGAVIWSMLVSVGTVIATTIQHIVNTLVSLIELPFKIMAAFWLQIKPYVAVFAKHVEMTGSDLSNGVTSMGKVASLMGAAK